MTERDENLGRILEALFEEFHNAALLESDPLSFVYRYTDPKDREVVALICAAFAFGNVTAMKPAIEKLLSPLGQRPHQMLAEREPAAWRNTYRNFGYRWVRAADARVLMAWIGIALREHGTLEALWHQLDDADEETVLPTLERWVEALTSRSTPGLRPTRRVAQYSNGKTGVLPSGAHLLLTSPKGKSACKRMNMFLRWVVRPADGIDLGLWDVSPSRLVMPVDTHVLRAANLLRLTTRPTADLRAALEITEALRKIDPQDPIRFDFALVRPGIMRLRRDWQECLS